MGQVTGWYEGAGGEMFTIVACPRNDCDVRAKATSPDGPAVLVAEEQERAIRERVDERVVIHDLVDRVPFRFLGEARATLERFIAQGPSRR